MNKYGDGNMKEIFQSILKKIGKKIWEGKFFDVMRISKPIQMSHSMSFLQTVAKFFF